MIDLTIKSATHHVRETRTTLIGLGLVSYGELQAYCQQHNCRVATNDEILSVLSEQLALPQLMGVRVTRAWTDQSYGDDQHYALQLRGDQLQGRGGVYLHSDGKQFIGVVARPTTLDDLQKLEPTSDPYKAYGVRLMPGADS